MAIVTAINNAKTVAEIKEISQRNLGKVMCGECMKNKAKEKSDAE